MFVKVTYNVMLHENSFVMSLDLPKPLQYFSPKILPFEKVTAAFSSSWTRKGLVQQAQDFERIENCHKTFLRGGGILGLLLIFEDFLWDFENFGKMF